ncbi:uncharacterized protein LOC128393970 [Panonychus citri]|uniref:uncharacterized protein LOC128393970 n=1 Tax=Panonychus citri TaxID=50023 RepID=UPI00230792EE|nr:uncharacterized protein LOC128393970 [Panonychus citri]
MIFCDKRVIQGGTKLSKSYYLHEVTHYLDLGAFIRQINRLVPEFNFGQDADTSSDLAVLSKQEPEITSNSEPDPKSEPEVELNQQHYNHQTDQSPFEPSQPSLLPYQPFNDIKYDATLPDEILQSESSSGEYGPSLTHSVSDDTFNTEANTECMTTATTSPTSSRSNSPSLITINQKAKKKIKTKCSSSREAKRRKIWISIARREIPRAQKRRSSFRKKLLATCRKISRMAIPPSSPFLTDQITGLPTQTN